MLDKIKKFLKSRAGQVIIRFVKTFLYTCIAFYVVNKVGPFQVDYLAMTEIGLLAGFGFGGDKYIRTK